MFSANFQKGDGKTVGHGCRHRITNTLQAQNYDMTNTLQAYSMTTRFDSTLELEQ